MAEGEKTSFSDLGSIHASQSEFSISNSSPRLESNASSSTACTELRRDFGADLICGICGELFDRPVMVSCGHSFCESCIEVHCRTSRNCVICEKDVGEFCNMIPSITLDNIVKKLKSSEIVTSFEDLFIYDEATRKSSRIERTLSTRSTMTNNKKRCFFTIAPPTICSSPTTEKRQFSKDALPVKSALKYPSDFYSGGGKNESVLVAEEDGEEEPDFAQKSSIFKRNGYGRRSERFTSCTIQKEPEKIEPPRRNSLLRRSLNALRTSGTKIHAKKMNPQEDSEILIEPAPKPPKKSSIWRRLFIAKKAIAQIKEDPAKEKIEEFGNNEKEMIPEETYSFFVGIGKKFEKKCTAQRENRNQISIVVFGTAQVGKTFFVKKLREVLEENCEERVEFIHVAERYAMGGVKELPFPEGDNRLPHVLSFMVRFEDGTSTLVDIIDPEYDPAHLPESYMKICDAAIFLIDHKNCGTVLTAYQIFRNMRHEHHKIMIECDMIINCRVDAAGKLEKVQNSAVCENFAKTMKAPVYELNVAKIDQKLAQQLLTSLVRRVIDARNVANTIGTAV